MSKKKSLGSSPIGYSSLGVDSFEFIPSIEVNSPSCEQEETETIAGNGHNSYDSVNKYEALFTSNTNAERGTGERGKKKTEKKIVSYYLEEDLIEHLKRVADEKKMYYSTLVSNAIYRWLEQNSY